MYNILTDENVKVIQNIYLDTHLKKSFSGKFIGNNLSITSKSASEKYTKIKTRKITILAICIVLFLSSHI